MNDIKLKIAKNGQINLHIQGKTYKGTWTAEMRIMRILLGNEKAKITSRGISDYYNYRREYVSTVLKRLFDEKKLTRERQGRGFIYNLKENNNG